MNSSLRYNNQWVIILMPEMYINGSKIIKPWVLTRANALSPLENKKKFDLLPSNGIPKYLVDRQI